MSVVGPAPSGADAALEQPWIVRKRTQRNIDARDSRLAAPLRPKRGRRVGCSQQLFEQFAGDCKRRRAHFNAQQRTIDFAKALSVAVDALGQDCRCVIVNKAAILGGTALDYTELVREKLR